MHIYYSMLPINIIMPVYNFKHFLEITKLECIDLDVPTFFWEEVMFKIRKMIIFFLSQNKVLMLKLDFNRIE